MPDLPPHQALVRHDVLLDGRLALFHLTQRWLAVADLHFGYEISQRAAGRLVPMWGMASVRERLALLLAEYQPVRLVIVGDLVHDRSSRREARALIDEVSASCVTVIVAGNHDRELGTDIQLVDSWSSEGFHFHHGHCKARPDGRIQVIGHHHPAGVIRDGAGLRVKCPAFVQQDDCWIMPAFSPWASGSPWPRDEQSRMWLCTPQRILRIDPAENAA